MGLLQRQAAAAISAHESHAQSIGALVECARLGIGDAALENQRCSCKLDRYLSNYLI
jgi:hypothetical protein